MRTLGLRIPEFAWDELQAIAQVEQNTPTGIARRMVLIGLSAMHEEAQQSLRTRC